MRAVTKVLALIATAGLAASMAACSSDKPSPQHSFGELTGTTTTITLDTTFVTRLAGLGVTPTPIGRAKVAIPALTFPITGGHLDVYKEGDATPPVKGEIDHKGSGIELTVGKGKKKTVVALKNLIIDLDGSSLTGSVTRNGQPFAKNGELFTLDSSKMAAPAVSPSGAVTLSGITVELSDDAATALNIAFKSKVKVNGGLPVGTVTIVATGKS